MCTESRQEGANTHMPTQEEPSIPCAGGQQQQAGTGCPQWLRHQPPARDEHAELPPAGRSVQRMPAAVQSITQPCMVKSLARSCTWETVPKKKLRPQSLHRRGAFLAIEECTVMTPGPENGMEGNR
eukprot:scaffold24976_cov20-Tisochrysis_lutea.AAC.2